MKVLFCTDGSESSEYAIKKTIPFLSKEHEISLLSVMDWGYFPTYVSFPEEEEFYPDSKYISQEILDKAEDLVNTFGFEVSKKEYLSGSPDDMILKEIKANNYDLVVLGSQGKKGIRSWLGSVSRKVVYKSTIPVLIARPPKNEKIVTVKEKPDILVATDGSACSYNAIHKLSELFNIKNSNIDVITIMPGPETLPLEIAMDNKWLEKCLLKQKEIAQEILETSDNIFKQHDKQIRSKVALEGDAADEILKYSQNIESELIVMGSHGREGVSDILLGSVSKRVLDNSYIPVLIIPTKRI